MNSSRRLLQMKQIQEEAYNLFKQKNTDYGDAFSTYGTVGVIVRIGDKLQRMSNIHKNGITLVQDESLRDTLLDLYNYSAMALMTMDDVNENTKNTTCNESYE